MRYELWLGLRYLFAKRREKFISIIAVLSIGGVTLGVAALIVVLAVMSGFDHDITDKLVNTNSHLIVESPDGIADRDEVMRLVSARPHVQGVSPFVAGQAILRLPDRAFGVLLRGIDPQREVRVNQLSNYLMFGTLPLADDHIIIGTELAASLQVSVGSPLTLISPADGKTHEMKISGLFRSGMYEYDATLVAVTLARAQRLYALGDRVTGIGIKLDSLDHADAVAMDLQRALPSHLRVKTWMELNPALFGALKVEKTVMFIILSLIIVVAALNIMSMLIMIVMEKTKDIGTLRALGATRGSIAALFLSQGVVIGLIGIGLGLAGGLSLAANLNGILKWIESTTGWSLFPSTVYYLDHIPARINGGDVAAIVTAAFALAALAGTYAAARAARLSPVDALRYE
jgi:lipoprotein-releasing system permease protein